MNRSHIAEVFPLTYSELSLATFRLSPKIDKKLGNSFGWHFSKSFPGIVVVWDKGEFWVLAEPGKQIPSNEQWRTALENIQSQLKERSDDKSKTTASLSTHFIQWVDEPKITSSIIAQLAVRILRINCRFSSPTVNGLKKLQDKLQVQRECDFWAETIEINARSLPAINLSVRSAFLYKESLEHFIENHPYRNEPEKLLINLFVRDIDSNHTATIVGHNGVMKEHRERLLKLAKGATSKEKLLKAPDEQPVVRVQFGYNSDIYDYAMAALRPCVTSQTASRFDVEYGELLRMTKILYSERSKLLATYKQEAKKTLSEFGLDLANKCINNFENEDLFWQPETKLEDVLLLFGNKVTSPKCRILAGLRKGGVYYRHENFQDPNRPIRLAVINLTSIAAKPLFNEVKAQLEKYKFKISIARENIKRGSLEGVSKTEARAKVQALVDEIAIVPIDLVLVFLPESDRGSDDSEGDSIYSWVFSQLLRRKIASQVIYEKTLRGDLRNVSNQVVLGILAKLGNLPFILAEPLPIADYFIGLDISRRLKKNGKGTINACACLRLYGKQGEFIRYQIASDSATEGEEIPSRILQDFLPAKYFKGRKVLIYRDGLFRGNEVQNILDWGNAIGCRFILVECAKSQIPRLYDSISEMVPDGGKFRKIAKLQMPTRGLALKLSPHEAILVTTQVSENIGVSRPLRLRVREEGLQVDLKELVDTTLKLTLLHHGSLKDPRLPIPLFGADRIAYRRLQGISPLELEGNIQYWL